MFVGVSTWDFSSRGVSYDPDAANIFSRMTAPQSEARMSLINDAVVNMKDEGIWPNLDIFHVSASADSQSGRINWINGSYTLVAVNAPVHQVDRGFTGDGATSYLRNGYNTSTAAKLLQNSNTHGVVTLTKQLANRGDYGTSSNLIGSQSTSDNALFVKDMTASFNFSTITTSVKSHNTVSRNSSGSFDVYKDGAYVSSVTVSSSARENLEWYMCGYNNGGTLVGTTRQVAAMYAGGNLTSTQIAALNTILDTYFTGVGIS